MKSCAACGTTKNINGSLGGVLLCREHFADISAEVDALHASGQLVDVTRIARRIYHEQYSVDGYLLRDIPTELWTQAKHRAVDEGISLRELIFAALRAYIE
jgi:hypothetical protein